MPSASASACIRSRSFSRCYPRPHCPCQQAHSKRHCSASPWQLNAAWFAAASIVSRKWLFRITRKVADHQNSPVLFANAHHHRSDACSGVVALVANLGSGWFPALPLDPIVRLRITFKIDIFLCFIFGSCFYFHFSWIGFLGVYRHLPTRPLNIYSGVHFMK
jgi:hypothetical protein